MDTSRLAYDLSRSRCGPCWRGKKGCDGNWPLCKRCELAGKDCDWPQEAQYGSSPTTVCFASDQVKENEVHDDDEMTRPIGPKRKRVPAGERVGRKVIRVPERPPSHSGSQHLPTTEPDLNDDSEPTIKITNPAVLERISDIDLERIATFHRSLLQAQQDYIFAQRGDNRKEIEKARSALNTFEEQFDRVGKEYEEFLSRTDNITDSGARQYFQAIDLPWDKYLQNFHKACDGSFKDTEGKAVVPPVPDMNVNRADPALTNFTLNWDWSAELRDGSINPALPPMVFDHPDIRQAINPRVDMVESKNIDWPTLVKVDADELVAGEGHEEPWLTEFDEVFATLETARLVEQIAKEPH